MDYSLATNTIMYWLRLQAWWIWYLATCKLCVYVSLCVCTFIECACCMHRVLRLVLAYLATHSSSSLPLWQGGGPPGLERSGWKRGLLACIRPHMSREMRGRRREISDCSIRKAPGGDSTNYFQPDTEQLTAGSHRQTAWLPGVCMDGWETQHQRTWQMYTHNHSITEAHGKQANPKQ